jgi:putative zinc finger/helix-turn-helix YgiT family protein
MLQIQTAKPRPFPWRCSDCFTRTVVPTVIDYTAKVKQDGVVHELHLPGIEVPRCQTCGALTITTAVDELVNDALRSHLRLLTPAQVRKGIEKLGLKQQEFAERLGVAAETISRWVTGALIQSRAMDNLLRVYFGIPEVRVALRGADQDPSLGATVVHGSPAAVLAAVKTLPKVPAGWVDELEQLIAQGRRSPTRHDPFSEDPGSRESE